MAVIGNLSWVNLGAVAEALVAAHQPADRVFAEQVRRVRAATPSEWEDGLAAALRRPTRWGDTHPCLTDRLAAVGVKPRKALKLAADLSGEPSTGLFANWPVVERHLTKTLLDIVRAGLHARRDEAADIAAIVRAGDRRCWPRTPCPPGTPSPTRPGYPRLKAG